ncbi:hypothetical protein EG68_08335 [Paragonimus skrjabini miyazakii]|uniref:Acetyl-CoA C-acetyltransferase n=1 Tax=Paragonimus skrjabini miyazakii TaxID=59628 RepID=A0A8S9YBE0_9TREM|nr:hypothetical protein EG68_08335 [Paragonimus skrjabini miyazakii]
MLTERGAGSPFTLHDVFIVAARRSPIGRMSGCLSALSAHQIGSQVITSVLNDIPSSTITGTNPRDYIIQQLEEVIVGQVFTASAGQNPARQAAVLAGLPYTVPTWSVNMLCGSGLKAVCLAYDRLRLGGFNVSHGGWVLAGGQESMSQAPHACPSGSALRRGGGPNTSGLPHLGDFRLIDTVVHDGLTDAYSGLLMGQTAEIVARKYNVKREEQDVFALHSQKKYIAALEKGYWNAEISPIKVPAGQKGEEPITITTDEHPRPHTTLEALGRLQPAFGDSNNSGTVTAGNASGVNDGAAFLLLCREDQLTACGLLDPLARVVGWYQVGLDPELMGMGPVGAIRGLLCQLNWTVDQVDAFELNEAFAAQSIAVANELRIPSEKLNMCGGGIALGHPLGCSGARILVTLVHCLRRLRDEQKATERTLRGIAALCIGGGMGIALAVVSCA